MCCAKVRRTSVWMLRFYPGVKSWGKIILRTHCFGGWNLGNWTGKIARFRKFHKKTYLRTHQARTTKNKMKMTLTARFLTLLIAWRLRLQFRSEHDKWVEAEQHYQYHCISHKVKWVRFAIDRSLVHFINCTLNENQHSQQWCWRCAISTALTRHGSLVPNVFWNSDFVYFLILEVQGTIIERDWSNHYKVKGRQDLNRNVVKFYRDGPLGKSEAVCDFENMQLN